MKKVKMRSKRIIALILALTMAFGTYITAFAEWSWESPHDQQWLDGKYKVVYVSNAPTGSTVSGTMDNSYLKYAHHQYLRTNTYVCAGYNFMGWSKERHNAYDSNAKKKNMDIDYDDSERVWIIKLNGKNKLTLYAVWQEKKSYSFNSANKQNETYTNSKKDYNPLNLNWNGARPDSSLVTVMYRLTGTSNAFSPTAPTDAGTYDIEFTVAESPEYKVYNSSVLAGKLYIEQATPTPATTPAALSKTYTPTLKLSNVDLPIGWTWDTPDRLINAVGNYTNCMATYTEDNSGNYKTVTANVTVTVTQATPTPATTPIALKTTYTPTLKLSEVELPTGWTWDADKPINAAGTYTNCMATYNEDNSGNYSTIPANVTVIVDKANYILTDTGTPVNEIYNRTAKPFDITTLKWKGDVPSDINIRYVNRATNASSTTAPTDVGDYDVYISVPESTNYKAFDELRIQTVVVISQAEYKVSNDIAQTPITYNGSKQSYDTSKLVWVPETPSDIIVKYYQGATEVTDPTDAGTYDVVISVANSKNYKPFEKTITGGLVIEQAIPTPKAPQIPDVTYDQNMTLSFVSFSKNYEAALDTSSVEGTWAWVDGTTKLKLGTNTYKATFTPTGKYAKNFKAITVDVPLTVKAATTPIVNTQVPQASLPATDSTTGSGSTATIADSKVAKAGNPDTSDANSEMLIASLAVLGLSAAGVTAIISKKKKEDM